MQHLRNDLEGFDFLADHLNKGIVQYKTSSAELFTQICNSFPICSNRIDWSSIPHLAIPVLAKYPEFVAIINVLIAGIIEKYDLNKEEDICICFDGVTEGAFSMPLNVLTLWAGELFTFPQHSYVIPEHAGWCIHYSFEDILYFGPLS